MNEVGLVEVAELVRQAGEGIDGAASQGGRVWPFPKAKNNEPFNGFHRAITPKVLGDD